MHKYLLLGLVGLAVVMNAQAFDLELVANNKESESRLIRSKQERKIKKWLLQNNSSDLLQNAKLTLSKTLQQFKIRDAYCDIGFTRLLSEKALANGIITHERDFKTFVAYLRQNNIIDDLLYSNIIQAEKINSAFNKKSISEEPIFPVADLDTEATRSVDVETVYSDFKSWPDEISSCSIGRYSSLALGLTWKDRNSRDKLLRKLNYLAYQKSIISVETYNKLEVIRKEKALDWNLNIIHYFEILSNAKDKLSPTGKPDKDPSIHSTKYSSRKEKLTKRGRLYKNFDSTQIMMLAEIIHKTSKRMDAHYVAINFQFENKKDSETETYVLSPMERYRLSIKMLRKDMAEVMRSEMFKNTPIEYEDLVTAAYETGLIRSAELDLILKFEDFWNPKQPKWKAYASFAFSIVGTSTFYLPPPWNIMGAIALIVTQTQLNKKQMKPDADNNWNVVL